MNQKKVRLQLLSRFNEICESLTQQKILRNMLDECQTCRPLKKVIGKRLDGLTNTLEAVRREAVQEGVSESELDRIVAYWKGRWVE